MDNTWVIASALLALLLFWAVGAYNRLVRLRAAVGSAFAALDPLLGERLTWARSALAPAGNEAPPGCPDEGGTDRLAALARLLAACDQFALALAPVRARPADGAAMSRLALAQSALEAAWDGVSDRGREGEPTPAPLQAQWERLQHQEQALAVAFNEAVRLYNTAVGQFPAAVMARLGGFRAAQALPLPPGASG